MPIAPGKACGYVGCATVSPPGKRYCRQHQRERSRSVDAARGSAASRGYGHEWRVRIRPAALAREPLCRECGAIGRVTAATEVDHIDGNSRNNDPDNLRALCKSHHSQRTARDQSFGRGRAGRISGGRSV